MADNDGGEIGQPGWTYSPTDQAQDVAPDMPAQSDKPSVKNDKYSWQAHDSMSVNKGPLWYLALILSTLIIAAAIYLITKDKMTTGVILFCGIVFGIYAAKRPKIINYQMDRSGFNVNDRYYSFNNYRSFSIMRRGDNLTAILVPLKRLLPYMYINFTSEKEVEITDTLMDIMPREMVRMDLIDRILHLVGF